MVFWDMPHVSLGVSQSNSSGDGSSRPRPTAKRDGGKEPRIQTRHLALIPSPMNLAATILTRGMTTILTAAMILIPGSLLPAPAASCSQQRAELGFQIFSLVMALTTLKTQLMNLIQEGFEMNKQNSSLPADISRLGN